MLIVVNDEQIRGLTWNLDNMGHDDEKCWLTVTADSI